MKKLILLLLVFLNLKGEGKMELRDLAEKKNFLIGAAVSINPFMNDEKYRELLKDEFNIIVGENCFKQKNVWKDPYKYNFKETDALVEFAIKNNIKIRGHTLVWHHSVPDWLLNGNYSSEEVKKMLEKYIKTLVGRYKGKIIQWDVVNEGISDKEPFDLRKDSFWYKKLGPDYIKDVFIWAHSADPSAKFYYNDYNWEEKNGKSDAIFNLIKRMKEEGIPIDGAGWQCHFEYGIKINEKHYQNAERLKKLGLELMITELDIRLPMPSDEEKLENQAKSYKEIFKFAVGNGFKGVLMWGFTDKYSWIPHFFKNYGDALIFDHNLEPKKAYYSIIEVLEQ